jgi:hypothetical protein
VYNTTTKEDLMAFDITTDKDVLELVSTCHQNKGSQRKNLDKN